MNTRKPRNDQTNVIFVYQGPNCVFSAFTNMATSPSSCDSFSSGQYSLSLYEVIDNFDPIMSHVWEMVESLLRLFAACDPYSVEDASPLEEAYPVSQNDYTDMVENLVAHCAMPWDEEEPWNNCTSACYGFSDADFIYLDDENREPALELPLGL